MCPSVENPDLVHQETGNSQSLTHPWLAERDSRQSIQTRSNHSNRMVPHPEVFQAICSRWHQPQVDLFATRFNNKLPQFVSPVPDPQAWAVDALSLSWEDLDPYAFPPAAILGKVVKLLPMQQDYPCNRIILVAPCGPTCPGTGIWWPCPVRSHCVCPVCPIWRLSHSTRRCSGTCQT